MELGTTAGGKSWDPTSCRRVLEGERSAMIAPAARRKNPEEEEASARFWRLESDAVICFLDFFLGLFVSVLLILS